MNKRDFLQSSRSRKLFNQLQSLWFKPGQYNNESLKERFDSDGIVTLPQFFDEGTCDSVLAEVDKMESAAKHGKLPDSVQTIDSSQVYDDGRRLIYSFNFGECNENVNAVVNNNQLRAVCEYLNRSKLKVIQHWTKRVYHRIPDNNKKKMMNETWHTDSGGISFLRAIIYLDDINEEQGPFEYIRGSFKKDIKRAELPAIHKSMSDKITQYTGSKGDVIIADVTGGWHRANPVLSGVRNTLQVAYCSPLADRINRMLRHGTYLNK